MTLGCLVSGFSTTKPIITFDAPGAGTSVDQGTLPVMVADSGETIGYFTDANSVYHGFIRSSSGEFTTIDAPGAGTAFAQGTLPSGISSHGTIVGFFYDPNYVLHGFLRDPTGNTETVDAPNAGTGQNQGTNVTSINKNGEIAGYIQDSNSVYHGFIRSRAGKFSLFDDPNAGKSNGQGTVVLYGGGLNSHGKICGFYFDTAGDVLCYLRNRSGLITSFDPLGSTFCFPDWINEAGVSVGCALANGASHGFICSSNGAITTFDVPDCNLGPLGTQPNAISPSGVITGLFGDPTDITHGFVRNASGVISEFDAPGAGTVPGSYQGTTPLSINLAGEIVGYLQDSNYVVHGFLRSPDDRFSAKPSPEATSAPARLR
jgi:hypothetical protein